MDSSPGVGEQMFETNAEAPVVLRVKPIPQPKILVILVQGEGAPQLVHVIVVVTQVEAVPQAQFVL